MILPKKIIPHNKFSFNDLYVLKKCKKVIVGGMSQLKDITQKLELAGDKKKKDFLQGYFKTGEGEYGVGDVFLGITVPVQRKIAHSFPKLSLKDIEILLNSNIHEYRFTALENLVFQYERADDKNKKEIFDFYLSHTSRINNWDLVDTSAAYIAGNFLFDKNKDILYKFAVSKNMWERRIAIIATHYFIGKKDLEHTLKISEILLSDTKDLIHKAVGWSLREVGKKDKEVLVSFLKKHYKKMPRTALRYALEKFPATERQLYMKGLV
ncbi:MAG: hypothetical protein RJA61_706 [Candidatus Parcubacteria bacterium]|jgi:3-methyladenine DNA glycosylase AlkD